MRLGWVGICECSEGRDGSKRCGVCLLGWGVEQWKYERKRESGLRECAEWSDAVGDVMKRVEATKMKAASKNDH